MGSLEGSSTVEARTGFQTERLRKSCRSRYEEGKNITGLRTLIKTAGKEIEEYMTGKTAADMIPNRAVKNENTYGQQNR